MKCNANKGDSWASPLVNLFFFFSQLIHLHNFIWYY